MRTGPKLTQPNSSKKPNKDESGHAIYCSCQKADDHHTKMCPQKAGDVRGESEQCYAKNAAHGV
eukprot:9780450-Karenia_brevis.AAC.1